MVQLVRSLIMLWELCHVTVPNLLGSILLAPTILYLSYIPWSCDLLLTWAVGNLTTLMYTLCRAVDQVSCMRVAITGGVVTLMRLAPFVGASKTQGTFCGRQMSDIVLTAWSAQQVSMLGKGELELWTDQLNQLQISVLGWRSPLCRAMSAILLRMVAAVAWAVWEDL